MFFRMHKVERIGMGITRMKEMMEVAGLSEPEFTADRFLKAIFHRSKQFALKAEGTSREKELFGEKFGENTAFSGKETNRQRSGNSSRIRSDFPSGGKADSCIKEGRSITPDWPCQAWALGGTGEIRFCIDLYVKYLGKDHNHPLPPSSGRTPALFPAIIALTRDAIADR
jgi:hypothetical protein